MMIPPVYATLAADSAVATLLTDSDGRLRVFPFGEAPQQVARVYVVWQIVGGYPENSLSCVPDTDRFDVQFDVYGESADVVRACAAAVRDAVEPVAYLDRYNGESKEASGGNSRVYRYSFDVSWRVYRA